MTISAAFNNALSGLTASGRASGVISDNIANALTPGYAKRSLELTSNATAGQGVRVLGVTRRTDPVLTDNRRSAEATSRNVDTLTRFHAEFGALIGSTDDPASLSHRVAELEAALITAASNPNAPTRLDAAATAASDLAQAIQSAGKGLSDLRTRADRNISQQVDRLNGTLQDIEALNARIRRVELSGSDTASLLDQRKQLVDQVNTVIPAKIAGREHNGIALYSEGGAILLDGSAATLSFAPATSAEPHMTQANGLLSDLEINGMPMRTGGEASPIRGGTLAAEFQIRDDLAVDAQQNLDALARDLIERFADPAVDPTLAATDPGLFTDAGAAFLPANALGLSNRLEFNTAADPSQGGQSWRLRDGLNASGPGPQGGAALLKAMSAALTTPRTLASANFGPGALSAAGVATGMLSITAQATAETEQRSAFASATFTEFQRIEQALGVDTDAELQSLMQIEQAYAANARVLEVVGTLMDTLLRI
ncbi:flagellar hook-associated protein FlgK [Ruegeria hyattellae]|uniref:flagellar hook-associated protein FlgK n=1 Tax=Ruegeria hyattellae TaxID=3233337 RepID=UPI00355BC65B